MIVLVDADILGCDMPFERGVQRAQVQVTVDAAELGGGFVGRSQGSGKGRRRTQVQHGQRLV